MKRTNTLPRKLTDFQLYKMLKEGNPIALEHLHLRHKRLLFWLGWQVLKDDFVVDTIVQDTFLKLWLHRETIETPDHITGFLRFVMKRDCIAYVSAPRNKFSRLMASLDSFENYQDYFAGYDPLKDKEYLHSQESDQKRFDEITKVLPVLNPKRKHLIELCLEYGFQYKPIAVAMGSSVTGISTEVSKAIEELRKILKVTSFEQPEEKPALKKEQSEQLSSQQLEIIKRRFEQKSSFAVIAQELQLPEKEVHREFLYAYQHLQNQNTSEIPL
ncbi:sigma-70 family RNA polymerase sigma factor [Chryseobacterium sp. 09-1422]|uniref:Sigma-70 family RNA polymerase sigma factor n=1 Tax=Chryseobacterium kimseyorum TaxID=2984028 RepID=A0ABT3HVW4_9FLAO|nr:sigma-70 family RNA polymerase sigma factor [Chryseobacterium kimseyorum]MCW3167919.1 sigma-70 family RNA polymerase sigma factor [Chryseobacterium kimseyorum]